jgi:hypothetical protein
LIKTANNIKFAISDNIVKIKKELAPKSLISAETVVSLFGGGPSGPPLGGKPPFGGGPPLGGGPSFGGPPFGSGPLFAGDDAICIFFFAKIKQSFSYVMENVRLK